MSVEPTTSKATAARTQSKITIEKKKPVEPAVIKAKPAVKPIIKAKTAAKPVAKPVAGTTAVETTRVTRSKKPKTA